MMPNDIPGDSLMLVKKQRDAESAVVAADKVSVHHGLVDFLKVDDASDVDSFIGRH